MRKRINEKCKILSATLLIMVAGVVAIGSVWALQDRGGGGRRGKRARAAEAENCEIPESDRKKVLAKIGETVITVGDFADEINKKSPYLRARYETMDKRKDLLNSIVRRELLAAEAVRRGLEKNHDVQRSMKQVMIQKLLNHVFEERVKKAGIPEEELRKFYQEHLNEYDKAEQVRISHILVAEKDAAQGVLAEAKEKGGDMREWRELVRKHSVDKETKARGGDLRYFPRDAENIDKNIIAAAFKLQKPGEIAGPIKTSDGFHIIRLTHRRKAFKRTFDEVKDQIEQRILRRKRSETVQAFTDEIREKAEIEIMDDELETLQVDTRTPVPGKGRGKVGDVRDLRRDMRKRRHKGDGFDGPPGGRKFKGRKGRRGPGRGLEREGDGFDGPSGRRKFKGRKGPGGGRHIHGEGDEE